MASKIYSNLEVLFTNLVKPNEMSEKYELTLICQEGSETARALAKVATCKPEKDGEGVVRIKAKSNNPVTCWHKGKQLDAREIKRGDTVSIQASLADWEYKGRKGTSLWLNAVNLLEHGANIGAQKDPSVCPFGEEENADNFPF